MTSFLKKILGISGDHEIRQEKDLLPPVEISPQTAAEYASIIGLYLPYFKNLSDHEKDIFVKRTWHFREAKTFHYVSMTELKEVPILVSASAIQITFGLEKYLMDFFKEIYIMQDAYSSANGQELYIGHVSPKGIYLSWKHFLQGFENATDNVNVAVHEMAHALGHLYFMDRPELDKEFKNEFEQLAGVFGPAFASLMVNKRSYLRTYAFTDLQEFWAVGIEAFFENPQELKTYMPRLYQAISEILNQDPLSGKPVRF